MTRKVILDSNIYISAIRDPSGASSIEWFDLRVKAGNPESMQRLLKIV